MGGGNTIREA